MFGSHRWHDEFQASAQIYLVHWIMGAKRLQYLHGLTWRSENQCE